MSSKHLKRGLIYVTYCLIGFFAIPYVLNHYGVSYTLTTAVLHILILILLVYTLYQYRQLDGVHEINQKYKESRQKLLLREMSLIPYLIITTLIYGPSTLRKKHSFPLKVLNRYTVSQEMNLWKTMNYGKTVSSQKTCILLKNIMHG